MNIVNITVQPDCTGPAAYFFANAIGGFTETFPFDVGGGVHFYEMWMQDRNRNQLLHLMDKDYAKVIIHKAEIFVSWPIIETMEIWSDEENIPIGRHYQMKANGKIECYVPGIICTDLVFLEYGSDMVVR